MNEQDLTEMIERGGIFYDVPGKTLSAVYHFITERMDVPDGCSRAEMEAELLAREEVLSTAVGNGIAIPHPRKALIQDAEDQRLAVCFLREPLDMNAPDGRSVYVMFILLTVGAHPHVKVLSALAKLIHQDAFRKFLEQVPSREALLDKIRHTIL